jgi:LemA protein
MTVFWWITGGAIALIALIFFGYYNRFVSLINQVENSFSQIDIQLKKRADLVPNLVASVKGYMKHESKIIDSVTEARKALVGAKDFAGKVRAGDHLQAALGKLFAIAENYPNLKANENFLQLQQEMSAIEDKIAYARQYYNDGIMSYNTLSTTIPGVWFGSLFGFKKKDYLHIPDSQREPIKVEF